MLPISESSTGVIFVAIDVAKRQANTIRSAQSIMIAKRPFRPSHARMPVMSEAQRRFGSATRTCPSCRRPDRTSRVRLVESQPRRRIVSQTVLRSHVSP